MRIKKQETHLTLQEHDDDDDILSNTLGENEGLSECKNVSSLVAMVTIPSIVTIEIL